MKLAASALGDTAASRSRKAIKVDADRALAAISKKCVSDAGLDRDPMLCESTTKQGNGSTARASQPWLSCRQAPR